jgi:hypothetical protein
MIGDAKGKASYMLFDELTREQAIEVAKKLRYVGRTLRDYIENTSEGECPAPGCCGKSKLAAITGPDGKKMDLGPLLDV